MEASASEVDVRLLVPILLWASAGLASILVSPSTARAAGAPIAWQVGFS